MEAASGEDLRVGEWFIWMQMQKGQQLPQGPELFLKCDCGEG